MAQANILGIDFIEFYVGNLIQASHFYKTALGFSSIAYRDHNKDFENSASVLLRQNKIYFILTSTSKPTSTIAVHISKHGDGVKDIALLTDNVNEAFAKAIECGARVIQPPTVVNDNGSKIIKAIISTFGETQHTLIEREGEADFFLPGFEQQANDIGNTKVDLQDIDHLAICIEEGTLDKWSIFYQEAFGFTEIYREEVHNGNSGMNSIVLQNELGNCKFTILEPLPGAQKSQIQNFLDFYQDCGVQHIALITDDIISSVTKLRNNGMNFLRIPRPYYISLPERISELQNIENLEKLQILVDRDKDGLLFQVFSKVIQTQPTFFIEVIQRQGATTFGKGNIRALFEAVAREQKENEK